MKQIRVLLADDHTLVRSGIRALLERVPEVQIVAEANDGPRHFVSSRGINLMSLDRYCDAKAEWIGGDSARREGFSQSARNHLSMYASEEYVWQALRSGAAGYLLKGANTTDLEQAVKASSGRNVS